MKALMYAREFSWGRLTLILISLGILLSFPAYCDPAMPPEPPPSSAVIYNQMYYFEGCDFGNSSVLYCPHPLTKVTIDCTTSCSLIMPANISCVLCTQNTACPECYNCINSCYVSGNESACGQSYSSGNWTLGSWTPLDTSQWYCPNARKLAELYTPVTSNMSFGDLSIGGKYSNSILRSGEYADFSFSAYVPACLDRIPMLRLAVKIKNSSGETAAEEYGLYVKHKTLDYINEDKGIIEDFIIPNQESFRETYILDSTLDGYVSWAWREQFIEAVEKFANVSAGQPNSWMAFTGDVPTDAGRVEDIYFSKDFVAGGSVAGANVSDSCIVNVTHEVNCTISLLDFGFPNGANQICNKNGLSDYYSSNGMTDELGEAIKSRCGFGSTTDIVNMTILGTNYDAWNFEPLNKTKYKDYPNKTFYVDVNVSDIFGMNYTNFKKYSDNSSNEANIIHTLDSKNIIGKTEVYDKMVKDYISYVYGHDMCTTEYLPDPYTVDRVNLTGVQSLSNDSARIWMKVELDIPVDFLIDVNFGTNFAYDCSQSWSWGNFSHLNSLSLAKCMYNWDLCFGVMRPTTSGQAHELAAAGYGPMEATPTLETNISGIYSDGRLAQEKNARNITVYRSCLKDDSWVVTQVEGDPALIYACPIEAYLPVGGSSTELNYIGKLAVSPSYPYDAAEGRQYMVLKCARSVSLDEQDFAYKVPIGSLASIRNGFSGKKQLYLCTAEGWVMQRDDGNTTCITDDDCPSGQDCVDGTCGCKSDDDCPDGDKCINGTCGCIVDGDCPAGQLCVDGACECKDDSGCSVGEQCVDGSCECKDDSGCSVGEQCVDGACECKGDDGCPSGQNCIDGKCINRYLSTNMFGVLPKMVTVGLGRGGFDAWSVSLLNKETHPVDVDIIAISRSNYPAAINWIDFKTESESCGEGCKKINATLPESGDWEMYSGYSTNIYLNKGERLGNYEYDFVVKDKSNGNELYRDAVWLNVNTEAVGSESILGLVLVFLGGIGIVAWRIRKK